MLKLEYLNFYLIFKSFLFLESVFAIFPQVREAEIRERASVKLKNAPGRKSGDGRKIQNTDKWCIKSTFYFFLRKTNFL